MNVARTLCIAFGLVALAGAVQAQSFPDKPIKLVVPFPAGGGTDIVARKLGEHLRQDLGQPVVVENKAGASGNIGADSVARSSPDGYTLMLTAAPFAIAPAVFKGLSFDPVKDFEPVAQIAIVPLLLVTRADSPIRSVADLVVAAKKSPTPLSYATFGNGAPPHLVGERIQSLGGFKLTHVPYKGGQAALPDILSGLVDVAIMDVLSMAPLVKAGRLRALAITGPSRSSALPEVPTLSQAGIAFDTVGWYAIFAPAKLGSTTVMRLNAAINKAMAQPDMQRLLVDGGAISVSPAPSPAEWRSAFGENVKVWGEIAKTSHIAVE